MSLSRYPIYTVEDYEKNGHNYWCYIWQVVEIANIISKKTEEIKNEKATTTKEKEEKEARLYALKDMIKAIDQLALENKEKPKAKKDKEGNITYIFEDNDSFLVIKE